MEEFGPLGALGWQEKETWWRGDVAASGDFSPVASVAVISRIRFLNSSVGARSPLRGSRFKIRANSNRQLPRAGALPARDGAEEREDEHLQASCLTWCPGERRLLLTPG